MDREKDYACVYDDVMYQDRILEGENLIRFIRITENGKHACLI